MRCPFWCRSNTISLATLRCQLLLFIRACLSEHMNQSVIQVCVAFVTIATALHCERSCARENVSVRDMPVSEEMWSSQVVLGRPLERLQQRLGGHPSPDSTADIERMLYAGTWHHVNVLYNGWACCGCEGESGSESCAVPRLSVIANFTRLHSDDARLGLVPQVLRDKGPCQIVSFTAFVYPPSSRNDFLPLISDSNDSAMRARHYK